MMSAPLLDLLLARGLHPRRIAGTHGGEYASPCPRCGGRDRFHIWPEREGGPVCARAGVTGTWFCRHEQAGGDALQFLVDFDGLDWAQACQQLQIAVTPAVRRLPALPRAMRPRTFTAVALQAPPAIWRERAARLADEAHATLLRTPRALDYLAARGLDAEAVQRYRLGYLPAEGNRGGIFRPRSTWGLAPRTTSDGRERKNLFIPRGITIPAYGPEGHAGQPVRVRIRRPDVDAKQWGDKYMLVEGGCGRTTMLLGETPRAVVVVEAELDAMLVHHVAGELTGALAVLTNLGRPDAHAHAVLQQAMTILVALDYDAPGAKGWEWWRTTYPQARRWPVPAGKDPGDAFALGENLRAWVHAGLPPALTLPPRSIPAAGEGASPPEMPSGGAGAQPLQEHLPLPVPAGVLAFRDQWQGLPVRFVRSPGGGHEWQYPTTWGARNREVLHALLCHFDDSPALWAFFSEHPSPVITADNLLWRTHD